MAIGRNFAGDQNRPVECFAQARSIGVNPIDKRGVAFRLTEKDVAAGSEARMRADDAGDPVCIRASVERR